MQAEHEWIGLKASLAELVVEYGQFRDLCLRQRKALIENDVATLNVVLPELEHCADSILLLDDRRRMHMELLSEASDKETLNLRELAKLWPALDFSPLEESVSQVRTMRLEIERLVRTNAALINSARGLIHKTLNALVRMPGAGAPPAQTLYGSKGSMKRDDNAVRNLLNKKG